MRSKPYWNIFSDALLICCGVLAAMLLAPTAYGVDVELPPIIIVCACSSLFLSAVLHLIKKPWLPVLLLLIAAAVYSYLSKRSIIIGAKILYFEIMQPPSVIFPFLPVPTEPVVASVLIPEYVTSLLIVVSVILAVLIALAVIRSNSSIPCIIAVLPFILLSMVYTDFSPALYTIILLMIYIGGVLLGLGIRRGTPKHALARFVFLALLFCGAMALSSLSPKRSFTPIPYEQRQRMLGERIGLFQDRLLSLFSRNPKEYDLNSIGDRKVSEKKAFSARTSVSGSFLLRTHSYGLYNGSAFDPSPDYSGDWISMHALSKTQNGDTETCFIRGAIMSERIVPYAFTADELVNVEEGFVRSYGETSYTWRFKPNLRFIPQTSGKAEREYYNFALKNYTLPDGKLKNELIELMDSSFPMMSTSQFASSPTEFSEAVKHRMADDPYQAAVIVARLIGDMCSYSLTPGRTPSGRSLVEYFISENKTGYCVHFASSTAAFLQALGIPARFAIGYRADIMQADEWQNIPSDASHAWVEIYINGVGWVPIECTPGFPENSGYEPFSSDAPATPTPLPAQTPEATPTPKPRPTRDPNTAPTQLPVDRPTSNPRESSTPKPTPSPTPGKPGNPGGSGGSGGSGGRKAGNGSGWLLLLIITAAVVIWQIAGLVIVRRRQRSFNQADPNAAVICMLRYLAGLKKYGVQQFPDAKQLRIEATFSNHFMLETQNELLVHCKQVRKSALKDQTFRRFVLKRILFRL